MDQDRCHRPSRAPPRQIDDTIPKELERICLKALAKRATERYPTARDMADDLRHWLGSSSRKDAPTAAAPGAVGVAVPELPPRPDLGKSAFVSYASPDQEAAFRFCTLLEEQGIGCWIAPRDVPPGADYGAAIVGAIEATRAMLLLLSTHANASVHVTHEVERATSKRKRVIPICLEDILPGPALELHLATAHRVPAWGRSPAAVAAELVRVLGPAPGSTASDLRPLKIVPKGLRSFDAHDADFFLELLPGPRDRDGLPDSIRFWKVRIAERDPEQAFRVGLIYGPSGCGKSSLVKAGLLPAPARAIVPAGLRRGDPRRDRGIAPAAGGCARPVPTLAPPSRGSSSRWRRLRRGRDPCSRARRSCSSSTSSSSGSTPAPGRGEEDESELVPALCASAMANISRPSSWSATIPGWRPAGSCGSWRSTWNRTEHRAGRSLRSSAMPRKVLTAFGRAYGKLPEKTADRDLTRDQQNLSSNQAVTGRFGPGRQGHLGAAGGQLRPR